VWPKTVRCVRMQIVLAELKSSEMVVSQEMVRHGSTDEASSSDVATSNSGRNDDVERTDDAKDLEASDSWLSGWTLPHLTDVMSKTGLVVQQTVQQTSNVVSSLLIVSTSYAV